jgi:hypothetical protein
MKKQTGIWLDFKQAFIIELIGEAAPIVHKVLSEVDTSHLKGGSRTGGTPWGPMMNVSESAHLERRKLQEKQYFEKLMEAVQDTDELVVFGPGEAKEGLLKTVKEHNGPFHPHLRAVNTAGFLTPNQKIAYVREFFKLG